MIHREQIEVWTVQLLSKDLMANANCSSLERAQEFAETLSSFHPYIPTCLQGPDGYRMIYLEGEHHADYSEDNDLELKVEKPYGGEE